MQNISGFGTLVTLIASNTYPLGITLNQFPDDADAIELPTLQIADGKVGLNGDLLTWSKGAAIPVTLNIIPSSENDILMGILLEANRVGQGKTAARDIITLTILYPDLRFITFNNGVITEGMPGTGISSEGRFKSKPYNFIFENRTGVGA